MKRLRSYLNAKERMMILNSKCDTCKYQTTTLSSGHFDIFCSRGHWDGDESIYSKLEDNDYNSLWDDCLDYEKRVENLRGRRAKMMY